jgi:hypothetical protein
MSLIRKTPVIFLVIAFSVFLAWAVLRKQPTPPQPVPSKPPNTAVAVPTKSFVVNLPDKALLRNYVEVSVHANPGTTCKLTYIPPAGQTRQTTAIADANGLCVWKWQIDASDGKGNARLIFTINGISETHFLEMRSSF